MKQKQTRDDFIRKREERKRRKRKKRLILFFVFFIIILLSVGAVLSLTVFFPIENFKIEGSKIYSAEQIIKSSGLVEGDNLFRFTTKSVTNDIIKNNPYVDSVKIKRVLPDTLKITVKDAKEYACYKIDEKYFVVSKNGIVLNSYDSQPENVFEVRGADVKCNIGEPVEYKKEKTQSLLNQISDELNKHNFKINYIDVKTSAFINFKVDDRFEVDLGTVNYLDQKITHLKAMIKNIEPQKSGKITLSMWNPSNTEGSFMENVVTE